MHFMINSPFFTILSLAYIFLIQLSISFDEGNGCPNEEFSLIAYEGDTFTLPYSFKASYLSFGANGFYSLQIISLPEPPMKLSKRKRKKEGIKVKCGAKKASHSNFGFVQDIEAAMQSVSQKKGRGGMVAGQKKYLQKYPKKMQNENSKKVCCVRPVRNQLINTNKFPLLPGLITDQDNIPDFVIPFALPSTKEYDNIKWQWIRVQRKKNGIYEYHLTQTKTNDCKQFAKNMKYRTKKKPRSETGSYALLMQDCVGEQDGDSPLLHVTINPTKKKKKRKKMKKITVRGTMCYPSIEKCNTKNGLSLTVFALSKFISGEMSTYYKYGFSKTGIFNVKELFNEIDFQKMGILNDNQEGYYVWYYPMSKFGDKVGEKQTIKKRKKEAPGGGWQLVSFCAACPEQTVHIGISKEKAKSKTNAAQTAHEVGFTLGGSVEIGKEPLKVIASAGFSYTYSQNLLNELSNSFATSTSVSIDAKCTAFYMYNFNVVIHFWDGKFENIPTRYFYCTDRPKPPECLPRLANMQGGSAKNLPICAGYDADIDFGGKRKNPKWRAHVVPNSATPIELQWKNDKLFPPLKVNLEKLPIAPQLPLHVDNPHEDNPHEDNPLPPPLPPKRKRKKSLEDMTVMAQQPLPLEEQLKLKIEKRLKRKKEVAEEKKRLRREKKRLRREKKKRERKEKEALEEKPDVDNTHLHEEKIPITPPLSPRQTKKSSEEKTKLRMSGKKRVIKKSVTDIETPPLSPKRKIKKSSESELKEKRQT